MLHRAVCGIEKIFAIKDIISIMNLVIKLLLVPIILGPVKIAVKDVISAYHAVLDSIQMVQCVINAYSIAMRVKIIQAVQNVH